MVLVGEEARGITGHRVNTYPGHAKYTVYVVYSLWSEVYIRTVLPLAYKLYMATGWQRKYTLHVVYSLWPLLYIGAVLLLGQGGAKGGASSLP